MIISQSQLALLYVNALLLGVGLGFFFDWIRIVRILFGECFSTVACGFREAQLPLLAVKKRVRRPKILKILVFTGDCLFCILAAIAMILLFYRINNGKIRFLAFPMAGIGFYLYRQSLGRLVMLCAETAAFFWETAVRYACFFALFPFKWLCRRMMNFIKVCRGRIVDTRRRHARDDYTKAFEAQMEARVKQGMFGEKEEKGVRRDAGRRKQEETVQPEFVGSDISGGDRGRVHRRVRQ